MATSGSQPGESTSAMRDRAHHLGGQVVDKLQETARRVVGAGGSGASAGGQGGDQTPIMEQAAEQVSEQVTSKLDLGKEYLVGTMTEVAQALRQTGKSLREESSQTTVAQYVDRGAEQVERVTNHLRQRDANELLAEVEWFARRRPMVFAGGAFALGMLAVRFLRSGGQQPQQRALPPAGGTVRQYPMAGAAPVTGRIGTGVSAAPMSTTPGGYTASTTPSRPTTATPGGSFDTAPTPRPSTGSGIGAGTQPTRPVIPAPPAQPAQPRPASPSVGSSGAGAAPAPGTAAPGTTNPRPGTATPTGGQPQVRPSGTEQTGTGHRS